MEKKHLSALMVIVIWVTFFFNHTVLFADEEILLSKGQTVYVPAYSHIFGGDSERPLLLTVTLSIRNVDPKKQITVTVVDYYATQGQLLRGYVDKPVVLKPLQSLRYVVPQKDKAGGSGANFMVAWTSENKVNVPIIEAVMISTQSSLGISFTSRGQAISESGR